MSDLVGNPEGRFSHTGPSQKQKGRKESIKMILKGTDLNRLIVVLFMGILVLKQNFFTAEEIRCIFDVNSKIIFLKSS